ncbi:MAG: sigma 54-interacting transcriptional regulator [Sedimentisphaerales bacterium]|nr:sigma 54-interacting transcriptional regulator [Sedimentisphaerales bacterium]
MAKLLLLGSNNAGFCHMAVALAKKSVPEGCQVIGAMVAGGVLPEKVITVMAEIGLDITHQTLTRLDLVNTNEVDFIIALTHQAGLAHPLLPGAPVLLRWQMEELAENREDLTLDQCRDVRDELDRRLTSLFTGGFCSTMLALKKNSEAILDNFTDGIVVHDCSRRIFYFNRAAEIITGYDRHEVLGQDCWDVFDGGLCSDKCQFCEEKPNFDHITYPLKITAKDGHEKRVEMSVVLIRDDKNTPQGVLATFKDVTEVTKLRHQLRRVQSFHGIIGNSDKMQAVYDLIQDLVTSDCAVLIQGESGTGKELVANAIHGESSRSGRPFVTVNCGALPEGILESELFGHVRGAFTGAIRDKKGRFELADKGTLFLDEIAELSPNMQVKLLRVLQEGTFERVGDEKQVRVDVRVISATNQDLRQLTAQGRFREDLYYRLCVVPVNLPPLRERRNDIPMLIEHFIQRFSQDMQRNIESISPDALHELMDYSWPGNIRELQNAIQYAFVKCKDTILQPQHLPPEIISHVATHSTVKYRRKGKLNSVNVSDAIKQSKGNKVKAAKMLGVGRATLYRFLREHALQ